MIIYPGVAPLGFDPDRELVDPAAPRPDLSKLHLALDRNVDALAGFETMVEKAEPEFRPVAQRFANLHRSHADRLAQLLVDLGEVPDADGTFMSSVNRAVVATRAFFTEIDADVMDSVRKGEENVIDAYRDALEADFSELHKQKLVTMLAEINGILAETRHLD